MAKSLRNRLNGNHKSFIEDIERYGDWKALNMWKDKLDGYSSYIGLRKFIYEETGSENFGLNPKFKSYTNDGVKGLIEEFMSTVVNYVVKTEIENEHLKRQLEMYKSESNKTGSYLAECMIDVMENIKGGL